MLTYAIPQKDVQPLARQMIAEFGSLSGVLSASPEALGKFKGFKSSSAVLIKLLDWIRTYYPSRNKNNHNEQFDLSQLKLFDQSLQNIDSFVEKKNDNTKFQPELKVTCHLS